MWGANPVYLNGRADGTFRITLAESWRPNSCQILRLGFFSRGPNLSQINKKKLLHITIGGVDAKAAARIYIHIF